METCTVAAMWRLKVLKGVVGLVFSAPAFVFAASAPEPADDIPPRFWERYGGWVVIGAILLLGLAGLAAWIFCRPRREAVLPPAVRARRTLEALSRQTENGVVLSLVGQALRQYVAAAFELPPGQCTTAEFCHALAVHPQVGPDLSAGLGEFLHRCDERKFSPTAGGPSLGAAARALEFVDQVEARRGAPVAGAGSVEDSPKRTA